MFRKEKAPRCRSPPLELEFSFPLPPPTMPETSECPLPRCPLPRVSSPPVSSPLGAEHLPTGFGLRGLLQTGATQEV